MRGEKEMELSVMKKSHSSLVFLEAMMMLWLCGGLLLAADAPSAGLPALVTSSGQSPDAFMVKVLCDRNKIKVSYNPLLKAEALKDFKTLMVVMGGSAKGLGEAGIDEKEEVARIKSVINRAKMEKTVTIGMHVGGEARRGPLSDKFIEAAAPGSNYLIVTEDGNKDGYFTKLSKEKKIPLFVVKDTVELANLVKRMFGVK
jgi:hypothetical protein